jgi:hypothetical protein
MIKPPQEAYYFYKEMSLTSHYLQIVEKEKQNYLALALNKSIAIFINDI